MCIYTLFLQCRCCKNLTQPFLFHSLVCTQSTNALYFRTYWRKEKGGSEVTQSCPTLCDPMDGSLPRFSVHGIFQARVLEWVAISFSRGSSWPWDQTQVSPIAGRRFTIWATWEVEGKRRNERKRNYGLPHLSLSLYVIIFSIDSWLIQARNASKKGHARIHWYFEFLMMPLSSFCI